MKFIASPRSHRSLQAWSKGNLWMLPLPLQYSPMSGPHAPAVLACEVTNARIAMA